MTRDLHAEALAELRERAWYLLSNHVREWLERDGWTREKWERFRQGDVRPRLTLLQGGKP